MPVQRTHGLFGTQVDSFSSEQAAAPALAQQTSQRPLQFSESQPESPPVSSGSQPAQFFPSDNSNNNAMAG